MCDTLKKILKIVGIIAAIAAVAAGIYYVVTKVLPCKNKVEDDDQSDYVSCSCCDIDDPVIVEA
ncbi:MAG: hypothetical protein IKV49_04250 [Clostridia bacterium]|nr:hypothetical protein [Clostridia bacterium]